MRGPFAQPKPQALLHLHSAPILCLQHSDFVLSLVSAMKLLVAAIVAASLVCVAQASVPNLHHFHARHQAVIQRLLGSHYEEADFHAASSRRLGALSTAQPGVFVPAAFGGDPTGQADSSAALGKAINAAIAFGNCSFREEPAVCNLHGAVIDLRGGEYAISSPIVFPPGYANYNIEGGSIVALPEFPRNETMLRIGSGSGVKGEAVQNIAIRRVTFDGSRIAATALAVLNGQNVNIGPAVLVQGFTEYGIQMTGTGAGYIHHSWLGELPSGSSIPRTNVTGTAISLEGDEHDCYIESVIIWSGLVGVKIQNGANQISGLHTWNLMTTDGGTGVLVIKGSGKIVDSYSDFCPFVIQDPKSMIVSNNLFLAQGNLVLRSVNSTTVQGLVVTNNRFFSEGKYTNDTVVIDGEFTDVTNTVFEDNAADDMWNVRSTRGTKMAPIPQGSTSVRLDFNDTLAFPGVPIQSVRCDLQGTHPVAMVTSPVPDLSDPLAVTVSLGGDAGATASVTCTVDQSRRIHAGH